MNELDVGALRAFVSVCESGSVTGAAQQMGITQSAVSQRLAKLEAKLNCQLIDRDCRPAKVTMAGQILLTRAAGILRDIDSVTYDLLKRTNQRLPDLKIGISDSLGSTLVPAMVGLLRGLAHEITVRVSSSNDICGMLLQRELHMVITSELLLDRDDLDRYQIYSEPLILVVPNGCLNGSTPGVETLRYLQGSLPFVRYSGVSPLARQIEAYLRRLRLKPAHALEFNESETVLSVVREGLGWTITTPLCVLQSHVDLESIDIRPLPVSRNDRMISLLARKGEFMPLTKELAAMSKEILEQKVIRRLRGDVPWLWPLVRVDGAGPRSR